MITRDNFYEVIYSLSDNDKNRILKTNKEYVKITCHIFNTGAQLSINLTDRYKECEHPEYMFTTEDLVNVLTEEEEYV
jgi:hypothetical protein